MSFFLLPLEPDTKMEKEKKLTDSQYSLSPKHWTLTFSFYWYKDYVEALHDSTKTAGEGINFLQQVCLTDTLKTGFQDTVKPPVLTGNTPSSFNHHCFQGPRSDLTRLALAPG